MSLCKSFRDDKVECRIQDLGYPIPLVNHHCHENPHEKWIKIVILDHFGPPFSDTPSFKLFPVQISVRIACGNSWSHRGIGPGRFFEQRRPSELEKLLGEVASNLRRRPPNFNVEPDPGD
eukprot:s900_g5.t1